MLIRAFNAYVTMMAGPDARDSFHGQAAEVADLMESRVNEIAAEIGQPPIAVRFNTIKAASSAAGYNMAEDVLYINPNELDDPGTGAEFVNTRTFHGLVLHELGHRADPRSIVKRVRLMLGPPTTALICLLLVAVSVPLGFDSPVKASVLVMAIAAGFLLFSQRLASRSSWVGEYAADDFCCDHAGIGVAAEFLGVLCALTGDEAASSATHPAPLDRFYRQMDRAGLPRTPSFPAYEGASDEQ